VFPRQSEKAIISLISGFSIRRGDGGGAGGGGGGGGGEGVVMVVVEESDQSRLSEMIC